MRRTKGWLKALWVASLGACVCVGGLLGWPQRAGSQGESPWPSLVDPGTPQGGGEKDAALIVSIEDYIFAGDIPGATANASDWYLFLNQNKKVPSAHIKWLRNQDGTRENIEDSLEETLKRVKPGGKLWFVYIGHGAPLNGGKDGGLVGVDGQQNAKSIEARSLPREALLGKIQRQGVPAVVVLDACFSGRDQTGAGLAPGLQPLVPVKEVESGKVLLLTAAGSDQYAGPLPGAARPAFSYLALGALRGWADQDGDGKVTGAEVRQYTTDTLFQLLHDRSQTPHMSGQDAVLAAGRGLETGPSMFRVLSALGPGVPPGQGNANSSNGGASKLANAEEPLIAGGGMPSIEVVEFVSEPSGQPVTVNGKQLCKATPCSKELPVGTYQVSIGGECVEERKENVRVAWSTGVRVDWKLLPKMASIGVQAYDDEDNTLRASVLVDGQELGQSPGTFTVSVCASRLEVELAGYSGYSAPLSLRERETSSFRALLKHSVPKSSSNHDGGSNAGMVRIPAGNFTRGSNSGASDEKPLREIYLDEFWIDTYEVTVDQYWACVKAEACSRPNTTDESCSGANLRYNNWAQNRGDHPVNCVSWIQSSQYCRWAGKRLPTEAQWEKAARGTDGRTYPWGEAAPTCDYAVMDDGGDGCGRDTTWPVGSKPKGQSPYGAHDMSGNVWEWVYDRYSGDSYQSALERDPEGPTSGSERGYRGGGFGASVDSWLRATYRGSSDLNHVSVGLGFRCAR